MSIAADIYYGTAGVLVALAIWRVSRPRKPRRPSQAERHAAFLASTVPAKPVIDTEPGINLADLDACELMLEDPEFASRCDRLWQAIRDEQQMGEDA